MGEQRQQEPDRRREILEAALRVFSERGFRGATIKEIAREAGIRSSALIYWYFEDKEDLFGEVLASHVPVVRAVIELGPLMEVEPEEVLTRLGRAYLAFDETNTRALRLVIGEAVLRPEVAERFIAGGPERVLGFLKTYLGRQVELGRLRPHDVRSSARAYIGMLIPQVAGKVLFPALQADGLTDEEHLQASVDIFLRGLEPKGR
ncbi:TetR/AcrR family transcriptional regulator [soil metagenome]